MGARIDLTGKVFGRLTVLAPGSKKNGKLYWKCRCECGTEKEIYGYSLRSGETQSCGCLGKENRQKSHLIDLKGKKFGKLTVLELDRIDKKQYWKCACNCGNITIVDTTSLQSGHTKSCGCLQKENTIKSHMLNLTNQKFGKLIALYPNEELSKNVKGIMWHCLCDCGKECDILATQLSQGKTKSCGCLSREVLINRNIQNRDVQIGQIYGYLKVTGDAGYQLSSDGKNRHYSYCECLHCGSINNIIKDNAMQTGHVQSCGCLTSLGETKIKNLLQMNHIFFIQEFTPANFEAETNKKCRFDFAIFADENKTELLYFIEYDGIQHFKVTGGWGTESNFIKAQEYDDIKNEWCKKNNIPIIRIPYTKYKDLCITDLILKTN